MGRTHGIHAEPITFGLKLALMYDEFGRAIERLQQTAERVRVGKLSGAVGTHAEAEDPAVAGGVEHVGERPVQGHADRPAARGLAVDDPRAVPADAQRGDVTRAGVDRVDGVVASGDGALRAESGARAEAARRIGAGSDEMAVGGAVEGEHRVACGAVGLGEHLAVVGERR